MISIEEQSKLNNHSLAHIDKAFFINFFFSQLPNNVLKNVYIFSQVIT